MKRLFPLLALALLVALALGPSLRGGFVWDDAPLIVDNGMIKERAQLGSILTSSFWETGDRHDRFRSFFRPVVSLSYALDYAMWGLNPLGFHLTNLLLHFICCWLVLRIAAREGIQLWAALAGAALFAVHPVHVESVAWISGRTDLLCALFMLAAFITRKKSMIASVLLFALALFSKEMAAMLPLLIFGERWLDKRKLRPAWAAAWPFLIVLGIYLTVRWLVLAGGAAELYTLGPLGHAATTFFVVARYLTLLILPLGLDAHYPYQPVESLLAPLALLSALILLVVAAAAWPLARRSLRGLYWLGWIFVSLLPVLAFGRFGDILLADRFLYLPSVGLALLLALWLPAIPGSRRVLAVVLILPIVALTALSARRCLVWRDDYTLFSDMARSSSHSALVRYNLGMALYGRAEYLRAVEEFRAAIAISPSYSLAHNNLAAALEREGKQVEALASYLEALRLAPALVEAGANAGNLLVRMGRTDEGLQLLDDVVGLHPRSAVALYALADALDRAGRADEALPLLERANRADPGHAETYYLLGKIHSEQGRHEEAAAAMRRFLELWDLEGEHSAAARRIISEGMK